MLNTNLKSSSGRTSLLCSRESSTSPTHCLSSTASKVHKIRARSKQSHI